MRRTIAVFLVSGAQVAASVEGRLSLFPSAEVTVGTASGDGRTVVAVEVEGSDRRLGLVHAIVRDVDPSALKLYSAHLTHDETANERWQLDPSPHDATDAENTSEALRLRRYQLLIDGSVIPAQHWTDEDAIAWATAFCDGWQTAWTLMDGQRAVAHSPDPAD